MSDLQRLETWLAPLLAKLSPAEQRVLSRQLAQRLRRSNQANMAAQQGPDGQAWEPRKHRSRDRAGKLRQGPMFRKLRTVRHLKAIGQDNEAVVAFVGRTADIARVHHYGLRDQVAADGASYQYPARPLLGVSDAQMEQITELVLNFLTSA